MDTRTAPGLGTTFVFTLPVHTLPAQTTEAAPATLDHPLRILIADDQPILCKQCERQPATRKV